MSVSSSVYGSHLILDIWGASHLTEVSYIEASMMLMIAAAGATHIKTTLHHFGENSGVTGVAILAESHISIHTWPETGFAAFDIYLCGTASVEQVIPIVKERFCPSRIEMVRHERGALTKRVDTNMTERWCRDSGNGLMLPVASIEPKAFMIGLSCTGTSSLTTPATFP